MDATLHLLSDEVLDAAPGRAEEPRTFAVGAAPLPADRCAALIAFFCSTC